MSESAPKRSPRKRSQAASHTTKDVRYADWDLPTAAGRVAEGLPTYALVTVQDRLGLSNRELADAVLISTRTLARRKQEKKLPADESERVYRLNRLVEIAAQVLGGEAEARAWMKEPNFALSDATPLEVARTQPGAELVEQILGRIAHGIPV